MYTRDHIFLKRQTIFATNNHLPSPKQEKTKQVATTLENPTEGIPFD